MATMDKLNLRTELLAAGWLPATEIPDNEIADYYLTPPDSLWINRPKAFYVYNAETLEELLNPKTEEDEINA